MATSPEQLCGMSDALNSRLMSGVNKFLKKRIQLQRLARLLEEAQRFQNVPEVGSLPSLSQIDQSTYNQLLIQCPQLGLPPYSGQGLSDLKSQVSSAYTGLLAQLNSSPTAKMGNLQDKMNPYLDNLNDLINQGFTPGSELASCLQSVCQAGGNVGNYTQSQSQQITDQYNALKNAEGPNVGNVLKPEQQVKVDQLNTAKQTVRGLFDE